jgi:transcriptional regulator with XRE-family HTH domain
MEGRAMKHKDDFIDREIGRRLRLARIIANIRLGRAAKLVGVTCQQIRNYELGETRVSAVIVARLAQLYERPVGWLLEEVPFGEEAKAGPAAGLIERERIVTKVRDESDKNRIPRREKQNSGATCGLDGGFHSSDAHSTLP